MPLLSTLLQLYLRTIYNAIQEVKHHIMQISWAMVQSSSVPPHAALLYKLVSVEQWRRLESVWRFLDDKWFITINMPTYGTMLLWTDRKRIFLPILVPWNLTDMNNNLLCTCESSGKAWRFLCSRTFLLGDKFVQHPWAMIYWDMLGQEYLVIKVMSVAL